MLFKRFAFFIFLLGFQFHITAQETVLDEVVVSSPRIELLVAEQSRSVTTITAEEFSSGLPTNTGDRNGGDARTNYLN